MPKVQLSIVLVTATSKLVTVYEDDFEKSRNFVFTGKRRFYKYERTPEYAGVLFRTVRISSHRIQSRMKRIDRLTYIYKSVV